MLFRSEAARQFTDGAMVDGMTRAQDLFGVSGERLDDTDWVQSLTAWASNHKLEQIVTAQAAQGPVAERLAAARRKLEPMGIRIAELTRAWDRAAWPHATKGFFQFREVIPALIRLPSLD